MEGSSRKERRAMDIVTYGGVDCPAEYLGDGVYAIFDGYGIMLHANSHEYPTDKIYLEPEVLKDLNRFAKEVMK